MTMKILMLLAFGYALTTASQAAPSVGLAAPSFTIANDQFVQDGKVTHLRAGCIHYSVRTCLLRALAAPSSRRPPIHFSCCDLRRPTTTLRLQY